MGPFKAGDKLRSLANKAPTRFVGETCVVLRVTADYICYANSRGGSGVSDDYDSFVLISPKVQRNLPDWF